MNKIIIINGPNLNLLGEREQSQYGSINYDQLKKNCESEASNLGIDISFVQSNVYYFTFNIRLNKTYVYS